MVRLAIAISLFALLACGGSETKETGTAGEAGKTPAVGTAVEKAKGSEMEKPAATVDPKVQSCLDLVRSAQYQQALAVCLAAQEIDPSNQQVQEAVNTARAETGKLAGAQQAAGPAEGAAKEAAGAAAGGATSKLGEAAGGMAGETGQ
jgi:hypothetical protein